ncbi:hypothetical protein GLOTRDRAFT_139481 [Gloeophyllum trabeum ATCC 11539]|uniref:Uncharacterized protein n=1 Tax=Gloeophyllum trabeum (strain ATCC 11539 / FP-39264 / Madison 617) TaxID=670483 RepID=S7Q229_GLOTA|nr:uncharacterized protein GLOTRDRAFT_139481 [Gloeophyllum trabeum ATCC 11539]EPQ54081.1 hypothetical protein GLOTRDRAFT_139481 [Gloeophyllum trabeum ATCC 11539]
MFSQRSRLYASLKKVPRCCRHYSDAAPAYHPKVRVYPFRVSPDDAVRDMSIAAALPVIGHYFSSLVARWFPALGFEPIKPALLQPLYVPGWMIDAEVTGNAWVTYGEDTTQRTITAHAANSYLPGFSTEPLARICLNDPKLYSLEPVPWSPELETQYGVKPLCLPFTLSPLGLLDAIRRLSYRDATIHDHFRFDPSSVRANLLAAYPILIPVYLGRYDYDLGTEKISITVILEASHQQGRVIAENALPVLSSYIKAQMGTNILASLGLAEGGEFLVHRGDAVPFSRIELLLSPRNNTRLVSDVNTWANTLADARGSFERLARVEEVARVDMDDLRVRAYTDEETLANRKWMALGLEQTVMQDMLNKIREGDASGARILRIGMGSPIASQDGQEDGASGSRGSGMSKKVGPFVFENTPGDQFEKALEEKLDELKRRREETKPGWLQELHAKEQES